MNPDESAVVKRTTDNIYYNAPEGTQNLLLPGDVGFSTIAMPGKITVTAGQMLMGDSNRYEHVKIALTNQEFAEARPPKARIVKFNQQDHGDTLWFRLNLSDEQRALIDDNVRNDFKQGDIKYAWSAYLNIALLKWGIRPEWLKVRTETSRRKICSQFVDRHLTLAGVDVLEGVTPGEVTPGDLQARFSLDPSVIPFRVDTLAPWVWNG